MPLEPSLPPSSPLLTPLQFSRSTPDTLYQNPIPSYNSRCSTPFPFPVPSVLLSSSFSSFLQQILNPDPATSLFQPPGPNSWLHSNWTGQVSSSMLYGGLDSARLGLSDVQKLIVILTTAGVHAWLFRLLAASYEGAFLVVCGTSTCSLSIPIHRK